MYWDILHENIHFPSFSCLKYFYFSLKFIFQKEMLFQLRLIHCLCSKHIYYPIYSRTCQHLAYQTVLICSSIPSLLPKQKFRDEQAVSSLLYRIIHSKSHCVATIVLFSLKNPSGCLYLWGLSFHGIAYRLHTEFFLSDKLLSKITFS